MANSKIKLGGLFYPTVDQAGREVPFDSLYIPAIYNEIWGEGVYLEVLNQKKDMVIVDVGSNIGITVQHFRPYAKHVYAIEPSPENFAALSKNKEFNEWDNVSIHNVALADKNGESEFSQNSANRTMNSLVVGEEPGEDTYNLKTRVDNMGGFIHAKGYEDKVMVKTQTIDSFFEENKIEHVDFMKFDPEGSEDMIIRSEGFKKVVDKIDAMECEFHFPSWRELVDYIISLGFKARQYESSAKIVLFFR
jgi:FkbM family methyltransferase